MASTWTNDHKVKLTKTVVDKIVPPTDSAQVFVRDSELKGFALRVTTGSRSFVVEKRIEGKVKRITLGRYPEITVEQARKEAQKLLGQIAIGSNPVAERKREVIESTTLAEAFEDFLTARKSLKERTVYDYRRLMLVCFVDWHNKPLTAISKDMVAKRHAVLGEQRGEAYANLAMRFLRSLFNYAIPRYETEAGASILQTNPVSRLTQTRSWYRVGRRQSVIKTQQLAAWYRAVMSLKEEGNSRLADTIADYLLLLLFTGLRRQEGAQLQWNQIDLQHRTLTITDTKNHEALTLPLSSFVVDLLAGRKAASPGKYVFAGEGSGGFLVEPRKQMTQVMIRSGIQFTLHDLRRTFITVAESLDISAYALKRLVNHKMSGDVTAGYIISDVERLRDPMQRISVYLLQNMQQNS